MTESTASADIAPGRVVFYLAAGQMTAAVRHAVDCLREISRQVVMIATREVRSAQSHDPIRGVRWLEVSKPAHSSYREAVERFRDSIVADDTLVFTGDSWFGPVSSLADVVDSVDANGVDHWMMLDPGRVPSFPDEGFPAVDEPWVWTSLRAHMLESAAWSQFWAGREHTEEALAECVIASHARSMTAFPSGQHGPQAAILAPEMLMADGCPIVRRLAFTLYPAYLHQQAFVGRDVLKRIAATSYPVELALDSLCRSVPPKALNTSAGMLEIAPQAGPSATDFRIVAIVHISDLERAEWMRDVLSSLPPGWDLVVTTGDGRKAAKLESIFLPNAEKGPATVEVRVTPGAAGRDMGDFFVACRDIIRSDRYDLIVKLHARPMKRKTTNVRRYFRRYQTENLLGSPEHVRGVLGLFEAEARLGAVFPPMMHVGFALMGRGWGGLRKNAEYVCARLGIAVPLDVHSPLAPYGGMWIARPAALRRLSADWRYRDYGKFERRQFGNLAHLQERLLVPAAAQDGYHVRTVLTAEHAAISHTALEYKVDELFSTTTGYPVDQIRLMHRAGRTGYGGIVGLSRMYVSLNHRPLSKVLLPLSRVLETGYAWVRRLLGDERYQRPVSTAGDES